MCTVDSPDEDASALHHSASDRTEWERGSRHCNSDVVRKGEGGPDITTGSQKFIMKGAEVLGVASEEEIIVLQMLCNLRDVVPLRVSSMRLQCHLKRA